MFSYTYCRPWIFSSGFPFTFILRARCLEAVGERERELASKVTTIRTCLGGTSMDHIILSSVVDQYLLSPGTASDRNRFSKEPWHLYRITRRLEASHSTGRPPPDPLPTSHLMRSCSPFNAMKMASKTVLVCTSVLPTNAGRPVRCWSPTGLTTPLHAVSVNGY